MKKLKRLSALTLSSALAASAMVAPLAMAQSTTSKPAEVRGSFDKQVLGAVGESHQQAMNAVGDWASIPVAARQALSPMSDLDLNNLTPEQQKQYLAAGAKFVEVAEKQQWSYDQMVNDPLFDCEMTLIQFKDAARRMPAKELKDNQALKQPAKQALTVTGNLAKRAFADYQRAQASGKTNLANSSLNRLKTLEASYSRQEQYLQSLEKAGSQTDAQKLLESADQQGQTLEELHDLAAIRRQDQLIDEYETKHNMDRVSMRADIQSAASAINGVMSKNGTGLPSAGDDGKPLPTFGASMPAEPLMPAGNSNPVAAPQNFTAEDAQRFMDRLNGSPTPKKSE